MQQGKLIFIMGVSGSGKGILLDNIKNYTWKNILFPLPYRTRDLRVGEVNGVHSWFISRQEFEQMISDDKLLEWAIIHQVAYYGTLKSDVIENGILSGKNTLKELDVQGLEMIYEKSPHLKDSLLIIFLDASDEILRARIIRRDSSVSEEEIQRRLQTAKKEREKAKILCDHIIDTNKTPEQVFEEVKEIFLKNGVE